MRRKNRIKSLFCLLGCGGLLTVNGQETGEGSWKIKGFAETYHALRIESPNDWMSSRTRFRGEVTHDMGRSSLFVSFNAVYHALLKDRTGFELREAYLDYRAKHWGVRAGRQLVIWGSADGVRITDLVSPMDMTEFLTRDYDDIRMPVNALRFFRFNDKVKLGAVLVPVVEGFRLPVGAQNPWSVLPKNLPLPVIWDGAHNHPAFKLSNVEYGGRLSVTLPGIDFSIAALHTWNKMPVLDYRTEADGVRITPQYYRMGFVGGDFSKPLGQFVLRGEIACNIGKHFGYIPSAAAMPQKGFNTLNWLAGVDWYAPHEWTVMAQFSAEHIFGYLPCIAQSAYHSLLTVNISKKLLNSSLTLSDFTYFDIRHRGWLNRFAANYAVNDQVCFSAGCDWLGGKEGMFGMYRRNSEIWMKAKYSF